MFIFGIYVWKTFNKIIKKKSFFALNNLIWGLVTFVMYFLLLIPIKFENIRLRCDKKRLKITSAII